MEEFNEKINNNEFEEDFINKYSEMIKNHKKNLSRKIIKVISEKTNKIDPSFIERLIDKYLSLELEYTGIYTINTISEEISKKYKSISEELSNESFDKSKLFESYKDAIKKSLERNKMTWINNVTDDFIELFINEIKPLLKENENLINDISNSLSDIFSEYKNIFHEEYQTLLRDYISKKLEEIKILLSNSKMDESEKIKLKQYYPIIELSNHELVEKDGFFYIKDKYSDHLYKVIFDKNRLKSTDDKINFLIDENKKQLGYINNKTHIRIIIHDSFITLMTLTPKSKISRLLEKQIISFSKVNHEYKFYYNSKAINNISAIEIMIKIIEQKASGIYDKLIYDLDFGSVLMQIKNYRKQQAILNIVKRTKKESSSSNNNEHSQSDSKTTRKK